MTETQTEQPDLSTLDGYQQLMAIFDGRLPGAPIADLIGLDAFGGDRGAIHVELVPRHDPYNPIGSVHGGIISAGSGPRGRCCSGVVVPPLPRPNCTMPTAASSPTPPPPACSSLWSEGDSP